MISLHGLRIRIELWWCRFCQCWARYTPANWPTTSHVYCIRNRFHFGPHRDNRGKWNAPVGPDDDV